jgi:hypothetical protein
MTQSYTSRIDAAYKIKLGTTVPTPPEPIKEYIAYKNGTATIFNTREEAAKSSRLMETRLKNKAEIDNFWSTVGKIQADVATEFHRELEKSTLDEYDWLTKPLYEIIYSRAYDESHAYGYDEVAGKLGDLCDFVAEIRTELKKEI